MVYVRLITPALAELLDAAVGEPEVDRMRRDFIEERLRALVHTQSPSILEGALWIHLVSQQQLLSRTAHDFQAPGEQPASNCGAPEAPMSSSSFGCPLPPPLQLPEFVTCMSDAVRWYCGELSISAARPAADECQAASQPPLSPQKRQQQQKPKSNTDLRIEQQPLSSLAEQPGARMDELIRQLQQSVSSPAPSQSASLLKQASGPLATVQLALGAFAQPNRASALRQPRSIALLVRNLVSLWSLVYLCKQLKRHQLRKASLLIGTATAAVEARDRKRGHGEDLRHRSGTLHEGRSPNTDHTDVEPIAVCFHDYDLLLPWALVQRVLSLSAASMAAVAAQCRAMEEAYAGTSPFSSGSVAATDPAFTLIINPAVTAMGDNPDRLGKNARIDAIDKASSKYYYALLATRAHGQASGYSRSAPSGASAASAAAHKEALRSSLSTVDIGEYGVLDPSRMRAPPSLPDAAESLFRGGGGGLSAAVSTSSETVAKSYALFLRDASIGFDIQVMALTGAGVGYYLGYLRGLSSEWCTLYAVIGLVTMMLVDAVLLMIRVGRQDEAVLRARKRIRREREKLEKEGEKLVQSMQAAAHLSVVDGAQSSSSPTSTVTLRKLHAGTAAASRVETDSHTKKNQ
ncbi:hypothetical protein GH5_08317 [Leishmania sp. Ghana 2012 LV757]|uniref:hypothetical protein n=1 Tax=Leishmania sp. Ghana 2012 LV757 TaxID=2803181 RepID=UPI001B717629|nr:hypothetical protein GH5_08317 [Leishmania sp. Ghana 2012 LV757]